MEKKQEKISSPNLSKKEFTRIISRLRDANDLVDQVNTLFYNSRDNINSDFCNGASLQISHESIVIDLLGKIMNDNFEMLGYFIYELDYGRKYEPGVVVDEDGNPIDISTPVKLYDVLQNSNSQVSQEDLQHCFLDTEFSK
jgi:sorbitol-specific phosphotransferase system component IIA